MAEAILNHLAKDGWKASSAGSNPAGYVNPITISTLENHRLPVAGLHSKPVDEFQDVPVDIAITLCNQAADEVCPAFLKPVIRAHWDIFDPASHIEGNEAMRRDAFDSVYHELTRLISGLLAIPLETLSQEDAEKAISRLKATY